MSVQRRPSSPAERVALWSAFVLALLLVVRQIAQRALGSSSGEAQAVKQPTGFWSPITSNIDWCEPNYLFSHHVVELWNAVSSLVLTLAGLHIFRKARHHRMGWACWVQAFNVTSIGIGSFLFHGTLTRWAQWLDELPMFAAAFTAAAAYFQGIPGQSKAAIQLYCAAWCACVSVVVIAVALLPDAIASPVFQVGFVLSMVEMVRQGWRYGRACGNDPALAALPSLLDCALKGGVVAAVAWAADFAACDPEVISRPPFLGLSPHVVWHFAIAYATHALGELGTFAIGPEAAQKSIGAELRFVCFGLVPMLGYAGGRADPKRD